MAFRFVHTADIHLDSPLRSLSLRNPDLAELIGDASRQALSAIVDLCLDENVDALIIAGDLYDGEQTSMKTARFLASQLGRLHEAGIATYVIRGNHDALSKITAELILPPSVKVFGARAEAVEVEKSGLSVAIHGLSFARPQAPESLIGKYRPPLPHGVNIGIMHTSLGGSPGHDVYAPCAVADLQASGFDYWALGHIHQRAEHKGRTNIIMPGIPQGRDINEAGAKGVSLVTIADDRTITVEERLTSIAEFRRVQVDLTGLSEWVDVVEAVEEALRSARTQAPSPHLIARLRLTGATPLAWRIRRDADLLMAEAEQRAGQVDRAWVEKLELAVEPVRETAIGSIDPVVELDRIMREDIFARSSFREEVRKLVRDLLDDLPPESRRFAGDDEGAFEQFLDMLVSAGGEEIVARMQSAERG